MQIVTLLHVDDANDPWAIVRDWVALLPRGSYVAITHTYNLDDGSPLAEQTTGLGRAFHDSQMDSGRFRPRADIHQFFDGLQLLGPGLVPISEWYPSGPPVGESGVERLALGGVGYKP